MGILQTLLNSDCQEEFAFIGVRVYTQYFLVCRSQASACSEPTRACFATLTVALAGGKLASQSSPCPRVLRQGRRRVAWVCEWCRWWMLSYGGPHYRQHAYKSALLALGLASCPPNPQVGAHHGAAIAILAASAVPYISATARGRFACAAGGTR